MNCRSCGSTTESVLRLGDQKLADFRADDESPPSFPLNLEFCQACGLAQLDETVPRSLMYHDRYGFKSGVNENIRRDLRSIVEGALTRKPDAATWLDIASNDGTLLSFVPEKIWREGIDPVAKYCAEAERHADRVRNDFFSPAYYTPGFFDVVTSVSMFYDIDDPNRFVDDVKNILAPGGVWVIQQNYLADTIRLNAVDNVCHEHITYWSLGSLCGLMARHDLDVFDVELSPVNGGCIRTYVCHAGTYPIQDRVADQGMWETLNIGLRDPETYTAWGDRVWQRLDQLAEAVDQADNPVIYGASTRGGTIWQAAGLDQGQFMYAVDRNPEKHGRVMASTSTPIVSEEQFRADQPDLAVVSLWFFRGQIVDRESEYVARGGTLLFPLPDIEIVG